MTEKKKKEIRKLLGKHLSNHREKVLKISSVRQLALTSNLDYSKLIKIEKGLTDIRFDTIIELAVTYKMTPKTLFSFPIEFWKKKAKG